MIFELEVSEKMPLRILSEILKILYVPRRNMIAYVYVNQPLPVNCSTIFRIPHKSLTSPSQMQITQRQTSSRNTPLFLHITSASIYRHGERKSRQIVEILKKRVLSVCCVQLLRWKRSSTKFRSCKSQQ